MNRIQTSSSTSRSPNNPNPCPECGQPLDFEPAGDDCDQLGRGEVYPKSWGCVECGKAWTFAQLPDAYAEAERVAKARATAAVVASTQVNPRPRCTLRLVGDLLGGAL